MKRVELRAVLILVVIHPPRLLASSSYLFNGGSFAYFTMEPSPTLFGEVVCFEKMKNLVEFRILLDETGGTESCDAARQRMDSEFACLRREFCV